MTAVERLIDLSVPVERVWSALTDPEVFSRCCSARDAEFEPRTGAPLRLSHGGGTFLGLVEEASAPHRFCYRLAAEPDREPTPTTSTIVEFRLSPAQVGTRVIVRESGFGSLDPSLGSPDDRMERSGEAWTVALERLARELEPS